ncbi:MAG: hydrogenase expression/formation protein HypE [Lachnospiraceae bacterium]|jgi:hydrogenase expression/formation protein HypE|nr:hydrogenase expression/formation protein HypE [Lachnospiraceae bacterium]
MLEETITMAHGSGGESTGRLISELFAKSFHNAYLDRLTDSSVVPVPAGSGSIAMTTDSFVVTPYFYAGGDIGRLSVCGTVNDLLMSGATPKYLTAGFILEEGLPSADLGKIVNSMAATAAEAGVMIVTGDTKVVESRSGTGRGGLMINTAGVGVFEDGVPDMGPDRLEAGDVLLLSGTLGEHHATILSARMGMENSGIESDNAPLTEIVKNLKTSGVRVRAMRDVTRGGLATVLNEFVSASGVTITVEQEKVPVRESVRSFCGVLGLDPLYMGNEGKMAVAVAGCDADAALAAMKRSRYGADAAVIGKVSDPGEGGKPVLLLSTGIGGRRVLGPLYGEGLPRIC